MATPPYALFPRHPLYEVLPGSPPVSHSFHPHPSSLRSEVKRNDKMHCALLCECWQVPLGGT